MSTALLKTSPVEAVPELAQVIDFADGNSDANLLLRFRNGDPAAFEEMAIKFRPYLVTVAGKYLRNHHDAEEIANDALVRAHRGREGFRGDAALKTWLTTITVNLARNRYWYYARRRRSDHLALEAALTEDGGTLSDILPDESADVRRSIHIEELKERVLKAFERLSEKHADILILSFVEGLNYEELASRLRINAGTVKSRLARAREALRANMSPE